MSRRRLRLDSGPAVFGISGLLFLLIGALLATIFCWGLPTDFAIDRRGVAVVGDVERVERVEGLRINRRPATRVDYRYVVGGRTYTDEMLTIDDEFVRAVQQPGARVALEVDREAPQRSRVAGGTRGVFGWFGAVTLIVPLIGLVQLGYAAAMVLRRARRRRP